MGETPTRAQRAALQLAVDNGEVCSGGSRPDPVRSDVLNRCYALGWLSWAPPGQFEAYRWFITDAGRRVLQQGDQTP